MSLNTKDVIVGNNGVTAYFDRNMDGDYITIHDDIVTLRNGHKIMSFYSHKNESAYNRMFESIDCSKAEYKEGFYEYELLREKMLAALLFVIGVKYDDKTIPFCYYNNVDFDVLYDSMTVVVDLYFQREEYYNNICSKNPVDYYYYQKFAVFKTAEFLGFTEKFSKTALREYLFHEIKTIENLDRDTIIRTLKEQGDIKCLTDKDFGHEFLKDRNIEITTDVLPSTNEDVFVAQLFSSEKEFDAEKYDVIETLNTNYLDYDELIDVIINLIIESITTI